MNELLYWETGGREEIFDIDQIDAKFNDFIMTVVQSQTGKVWQSSVVDSFYSYLAP